MIPLTERVERGISTTDSILYIRMHFRNKNIYLYNNINSVVLIS